MLWLRAIAVWLLIVVAESINGTIRQLFVSPAIGDKLARQIGVFIGSSLILLISWLTARWLGAKTDKEQFKVGGLWVVLIVIFEIGLGVSLGYSRERLLSDYNLAQGGLMGFGLAIMLFAPMLGAKLRGMERHSAQALLKADGPGRPRPWRDR
jgi:hypothetical protein